MKLDNYEVRELLKPDFWKKVQMGQEQPKGPKNAPTIWVFDKNLIDLYGLFFYLNMKVLIILLSAKTALC